MTKGNKILPKQNNIITDFGAILLHFQLKCTIKNLKEVEINVSFWRYCNINKAITAEFSGFPELK